MILTLALTLTLGAATQAQAQNTETKAAQIEREVAALTKQYEEGKITAEQFEQKAMEVYNRLSGGLREEAQRETERDVERHERRQQQEAERVRRENAETTRPKMPGTEGWPPAEAFARYGKNIAKPAGSYLTSYERDGDEVIIHLWKNFGMVDFFGTGDTVPSPTQNFTEDEMRGFAAHFEGIFGQPEYGPEWVKEFLEWSYWALDMSDPRHTDGGGIKYVIRMEMSWGNNKGIFNLKIYPYELADAQ